MIPDTREERVREVGRIVWAILDEWMREDLAYPDEINSGGCEGFAKDAKVALEDVGYTPFLLDCGRGHTYLFVMETGLYYDSESPYGVRAVDLLPFFERGNRTYPALDTEATV